MPVFQYKALQGDGAVAEGQIEAPGRQEADQRPLLVLFGISIAAIAGFYAAALVYTRNTNLAVAEAYVAANSGDLLVISQLCGYLIFYGGARKLQRVLSIMESVDPPKCS